MRDRSRAVRILAKSVYKELSEQGYDSREIVALATELIGHVTARLARQREEEQRAHAAKVRAARWTPRRGLRSAVPVGPVGLGELKLAGG